MDGGAGGGGEPLFCEDLLSDMLPVSQQMVHGRTYENTNWI